MGSGGICTFWVLGALKNCLIASGFIDSGGFLGSQASKTFILSALLLTSGAQSKCITLTSGCVWFLDLGAHSIVCHHRHLEHQPLCAATSIWLILGSGGLFHCVSPPASGTSTFVCHHWHLVDFGFWGNAFKRALSYRTMLSSPFCKN